MARTAKTETTAKKVAVAEAKPKTVKAASEEKIPVKEKANIVPTKIEAQKAETDVSEAVPVQEKEAKPTEEKVSYSKSELEQMIAQAVATAVAQDRKNNPIQLVKMDSEEDKITCLFQAPVADDNVIEIGQNGIYSRISGQTGTFFIPKSALSTVLTPQFRKMLNDRWIIVLSGMSDDDRAILNCKYKENEYLTSKQFNAILDLGIDLIPIFRELCDAHKEIVAKKLFDAYSRGDERVTRSLVTELNEISKQDNANLPDDDPRKNGIFVNILKLMNDKDIGR